jgi:hypothetical protein
MKLFWLLALTPQLLNAQNMDSTVKPHLDVEGYVDVYYSYAFSHPKGGTRPYFVSYNRDNEINVNLAYVSLHFTGNRVRATFTPGYGTYMNANYASERQTLQNIIEASVGFQLFKNKDIWLDAGVINSPYTYETAYSFDQICYTRSLGADNTPYYLTGAKLTLPLARKWTAYLYLLNGWQVIESQHDPLDFGSTLEYKPDAHWDINWNTYIGDESSTDNPNYRTRYFGDLYATYTPSGPWSLSADAYAGWQRLDTLGAVATHRWWNASLSAQYRFAPNQSLSVRAEHFEDPNQVLVKPVTPAPGFILSSTSLGYNLNITDQVLFRFEARYFVSPDGLYPLRNQTNAPQDLWLTLGLTARLR